MSISTFCEIHMNSQVANIMNFCIPKKIIWHAKKKRFFFGTKLQKNLKPIRSFAYSKRQSTNSVYSIRTKGYRNKRLF